MDIKISKSVLKGKIRIISSKSDAHRALICAALCGYKKKDIDGIGEDKTGEGILDLPVLIYCNEISEDIKATLSVISALGAEVKRDGEYIQINPFKKVFSEKEYILDCGESGSTLRFMLPVAAALGVKAKFIGHGRLPERPIDILTEELKKHGAVSDSFCLPLSISGRLKGGHFKLPGNISSQFFTGILLALPIIGEEAFIEILGKLESSAYVDMTIRTMKEFGVNIKKTDRGFYYNPLKNDNNLGICGNYYRAELKCYETEGDWSNASFFIAANALFKYKFGGSNYIENEGLKQDSLQGDRCIADIADEIVNRNFESEIEGGSEDGSEGNVKSVSNGFILDAAEIPDLVPVMAVMLSLIKGRHLIKNAARLRMKESDRLSAVRMVLNKIGADITELSDGLIINGKDSLKGGKKVSGCGDHRIVMALAVAGLFCDEAIIIEGAEAVGKSYPDFFEKYRQLGGKADVI